MARINRREVLSASEIQLVHCFNRCIRKSFLCGIDPLPAMTMSIAVNGFGIGWSFSPESSGLIFSGFR